MMRPAAAHPTAIPAVAPVERDACWWRGVAVCEDAGRELVILESGFGTAVEVSFTPVEVSEGRPSVLVGKGLDEFVSVDWVVVVVVAVVVEDGDVVVVVVVVVSVVVSDLGQGNQVDDVPCGEWQPNAVVVDIMEPQGKKHRGIL
jgi:hypothetical protein